MSADNEMKYKCQRFQKKQKDQRDDYTDAVDLCYLVLCISRINEQCQIKSKTDNLVKQHVEDMEYRGFLWNEMNQLAMDREAQIYTFS